MLPRSIGTFTDSFPASGAALTTAAGQQVRVPQAHGKGGTRMVRDYELMYIARPDLDEEGLQAAVDSVDQLITGLGGTVVRSTSWGRRRLAYEVDHLRDGHYMLLNLRVDGGRVAEIERALTIHETVFRHLLVLQEVPVEAAAEPDAAPAPPGGDAEASETAPRQPVVAVADDDEADEDDVDDEGDEPAIPAATEEEK
jgi:small subunit ribosomal protein S6